MITRPHKVKVVNTHTHHLFSIRLCMCNLFQLSHDLGGYTSVQFKNACNRSPDTDWLLSLGRHLKTANHREDSLTPS